MGILINVDRLALPNGVTVPPTITLFFKKISDPDFVLVESGIVVDQFGNVQGSPKPQVEMDAAVTYVFLTVNEMCGYQYAHEYTLYPFCPIGYEMAPDMSYCFIEEVVSATLPTAGENTVAKSNTAYSTCGSYIYEEGYNLNGTGPSNHIDITNPFWLNGPIPDCANHTLTDGPLNRCGLWSVTEAAGQTVGFPVCFDYPTKKTVYIGMGTDNLGIIRLDGETIVEQNPTALGIQYLVGPQATFKVWHIYPVEIEAGSHVLEMLGYNDGGVAAMGCEIYDNTPEEIEAATSYDDLNLIFSSKDYVGMPVMLGSGGVGFSCPVGWALRACASPYECVRIIKVPVQIAS